MEAGSVCKVLNSQDGDLLCLFCGLLVKENKLDLDVRSVPDSASVVQLRRRPPLVVPHFLLQTRAVIFHSHSSL